MSETNESGVDQTSSKAGSLDAELQRELDEALGDQSIEEIMNAERAEQAKQQPSSGGAKIGKVMSVQGDDIFVDIGGRSDGLLPAEQFKDEPLPEVGDEVEVTLQGYDDANGLVLLSRKGTVLAHHWEQLEEGQIVEARVTGHNKGGLELSISGMRAFMPVSQVELFRVEDLAPYVGRSMKCQVVEVKPEEKNIILSARAVQEYEREQQREQAWETLETGQLKQGVVRSIAPYGAFVDIGGVEGLLHVSQMSHGRVDDPKSVLKEGEKVEVEIVKLDREARKIGLRMKHALSDPWQDVDSKYTADSLVTGKVTRLVDFGAFVELEPGLEGLVPIGEITFERRIGHPKEVLSPNDMVRLRVLRVEPDRKRIGLSLKRAGDDPWVGASGRWPEGTVVRGIVKRTADFGAFVEIAPGVEGLVHISQLSDQHVASVTEVVRQGESIEVKVVSVDEDARRIGLSIRALKEDAGPARSASRSEVSQYMGDEPFGTTGMLDMAKKSNWEKKKKKRRGGYD